MDSSVVTFLSLSVLLSNVIFLVVASLYIFSDKFRVIINSFCSKYIIEIVLFISAFSMFGSLALSDVVGFPPCDLCWWLRIGMYPLVPISVVSLFRKDKNAVYYFVPLVVIGFLMSLYQAYIQWGGSSTLLKCTLDGGTCGKLYVYYYGYITIPFMALASFVYIVSVLGVYFYGRKS